MSPVRRRLLLCTDMDGTVVPYAAPEDPDARLRLHRLCADPDVTLVYVTGRDADLVRAALAAYDLPTPAYAVTDVGACIHRVGPDGSWSRWDEWQQAIAVDWQGERQETLRPRLADLPGLHLQPDPCQQPFKLSYFWDLDQWDGPTLVQAVEEKLAPLGLASEITVSRDAEHAIGLLDVLPRRATKRHAVEFLQQQLHYAPHEVVFAGDSGNDLTVMDSACRAILVANADEEVKQAARTRAAAAGHGDALYIATGNRGYGNGNYAAGVLEGIAWFCPEWAEVVRPEPSRPARDSGSAGMSRPTSSVLQPTGEPHARRRRKS